MSPGRRAPARARVVGRGRLPPPCAEAGRARRRCARRPRWRTSRRGLARPDVAVDHEPGRPHDRQAHRGRDDEPTSSPDRSGACRRSRRLVSFGADLRLAGSTSHHRRSRRGTGRYRRVVSFPEALARPGGQLGVDEDELGARPSLLSLGPVTARLRLPPGHARRGQVCGFLLARRVGRRAALSPGQGAWPPSADAAVEPPSMR